MAVIVHGDKELIEKPGRKDLCSCNSGRSLLSRTVVYIRASMTVCDVTTTFREEDGKPERAYLAAGMPVQRTLQA